MAVSVAVDVLIGLGVPIGRAASVAFAIACAVEIARAVIVALYVGVDIPNAIKPIHAKQTHSTKATTPLPTPKSILRVFLGFSDIGSSILVGPLAPMTDAKL
jgi:hypothetical protein